MKISLWQRWAHPVKIEELEVPAHLREHGVARHADTCSPSGDVRPANKAEGCITTSFQSVVSDEWPRLAVDLEGEGGWV